MENKEDAELASLVKEAGELSEEFMELPLVQRFLKAKKALENDPRLTSLKKDILIKKKSLARLNQNEQAQAIREIKNMQNEYDSDSLVVTYNQLLNEVRELQQPIRDLFVL